MKENLGKVKNDGFELDAFVYGLSKTGTAM